MGTTNTNAAPVRAGRSEPMTTCVTCDCEFNAGLAGVINVEDRCQECRDTIAHENECALIRAVGQYLDALDSFKPALAAIRLQEMRTAYQRVSDAT